MNEEKNKIEMEKRHQGVLLEDIDSKIDILVEGQMALDAKIDRNHEEFREFVADTGFKFKVVFEEFEEVDQKFEIVFRKFEEVDDRFEVIFQKFEEVDDKFGVVFEELHELRKERVI